MLSLALFLLAASSFLRLSLSFPSNPPPQPLPLTTLAQPELPLNASQTNVPTVNLPTNIITSYYDLVFFDAHKEIFIDLLRTSSTSLMQVQPSERFGTFARHRGPFQLSFQATQRREQGRDPGVRAVIVNRSAGESLESLYFLANDYGRLVKSWMLVRGGYLVAKGRIEYQAR